MVELAIRQEAFDVSLPDLVGDVSVLLIEEREELVVTDSPDLILLECRLRDAPAGDERIPERDQV